MVLNILDSKFSMNHRDKMLAVSVVKSEKRSEKSILGR